MFSLQPLTRAESNKFEPLIFRLQRFGRHEEQTSRCLPSRSLGPRPISESLVSISSLLHIGRTRFNKADTKLCDGIWNLCWYSRAGYNTRVDGRSCHRPTVRID